MPLTPAGSRITGNMLSLIQNFNDIGAVTVVTSTDQDLTAAFTIPGGDAMVGNSYEIEAWGDGTWGSTQQSLILTVNLGGNAMSTVTLAATWFPISQFFRWRCLGRIVCLSVGSTGSFGSLIHGNASVSGASLLPEKNTVDASGAFVDCSETLTIDTTVAQALKLTCRWNSTTGSPTIIKRIALQRKVGVG